MRKLSVFFFLTIFLLLSVSIQKSSNIFAQSVSPDNTPTPTIDPTAHTQESIQNINNITPSPTSPITVCGIAGDAPANICCKNSTLDTKQYTDSMAGGILPNVNLGDVLGLSPIMGSCSIGQPKGDQNNIDPNNPNHCTCQLDETPTALSSVNDLCDFYNTTGEKNACRTCAQKYGGYYSAVGCVPLQMGNFVNSFLLPKAIALAGLIAFFCIIISAFRIQISRGDKEALQKARETLTSCIIGMLVVVFAVFILHFIGVNVLQLPGLK